MKVRLVPLFEGAEEKPTTLSHTRWMIGRATECELRLTSPLVSRRHCEIIVEGKEVRVRDLGSSNGTFVNNQRVFDELPLRNGDVLAVATNMYEVEINVWGSGINLLARLGHAVAEAMH